jgi:hypothetical protein
VGNDICRWLEPTSLNTKLEFEWRRMASFCG